MLEQYIKEKRQKKPILLMTHIVLGYPNFNTSIEIVDAMVEAGVDLIELQIPFSEPMADGPVILHANQRALEAGATVDKCFLIAEEIAKKHPAVPLLFMTYFNIVFKRGLEQFARDTARAGLRGAIIPDLPHEESSELFTHMRNHDLEPIMLFSPSTSQSRMKEIADQQSGFIYTIARKGVTGAKTDFESLDPYLARCRAATSLPLALGFGVKDRSDVDALIGKVDIAVVGSQTIKIIDEQGPKKVKAFIASLRD